MKLKGWVLIPISWMVFSMMNYFADGKHREQLWSPDGMELRMLSTQEIEKELEWLKKEDEN